MGAAVDTQKSQAARRFRDLSIVIPMTAPSGRLANDKAIA
jgi:hypothetical protein